MSKGISPPLAQPVHLCISKVKMAATGMEMLRRMKALAMGFMKARNVVSNPTTAISCSSFLLQQHMPKVCA